MHTACRLMARCVTFKGTLEWKKKHLHVLSCTCLHADQVHLKRDHIWKTWEHCCAIFFLPPDAAKSYTQGLWLFFKNIYINNSTLWRQTTVDNLAYHKIRHMCAHIYCMYKGNTISKHYFQHTKYTTCVSQFSNKFCRCHCTKIKLIYRIWLQKWTKTLRGYKDTYIYILNKRFMLWLTTC